MKIIGQKKGGSEIHQRILYHNSLPVIPNNNVTIIRKFFC